LGLVREYRLTGVDEAVLQVRSDRQKFRPYGLKGGTAGANAGNILRSAGGDKTPLPGKFMRTLRRGECYRAELAGGGGWGDPFQRTLEAVVQDVLDEKISRESAMRDYGVVVKADGGLDREASMALRSARRAAE
jgi:N-methylhydantoinase B